MGQFDKFLLASSFALFGCVQTTDDVLEAKITSYVGLTMAEFMTTTGLTPSDRYETAQGRTYVVEGPGCKLFLETVQNDQLERADSWKISGVNAHGPCGILL